MTPVHPESVGYCTAEPAAKYYDWGEMVTVTAYAQPGYIFVRWFGEGVAWFVDENPYTVPGHPLTGAVDPCVPEDPNNRQINRQPTIVIKMDCDRDLRAAFTCYQHCGTPQNGHLIGDVTRPEMWHVENNPGTTPEWQHACLHHMHRFVEGLAAQFFQSETKLLELNDMSKAGGGSFAPIHPGSHENGRNIDLNYNHLVAAEQQKALLLLLVASDTVVDVRLRPETFSLLTAEEWNNKGIPDPDEGTCFHVTITDPD